MAVEEIIDAYKTEEFDDEAISEMASTWSDNRAMMMAAGTASEGQAQQASIELFNEWKSVCQRHDVSGEIERKALVLRGMVQFIEDSKNQQIAEMAAVLDGI